MAVSGSLARLGECRLGHCVDQLGLLAKMGEEGVQFGLDAHAHAHARQHDRDQRR